jgi:uncharacterized membrane protein
MEVILIILFLILLFYTVNYHTRSERLLKLMADRMGGMLDELDELKKSINNLGEIKPAAPELPPPVPPVFKKEPLPEYKWRPAVPQKQESSPEPAPAPEPVLPSFETDTITSRPQPKESWWQAWMRNNPDLEKFIGENLVNKIGIAVLVLGVAFFVKYAIDKEWINEVGRVCIGLACGIGLTGLAHYLRNSYRSFSSVLAGGGIAIFYFTIAFAFHQYALISQTAAFLLMVGITGFAVLLALLYDKTELAVIAAVGGFLTPFLVSNGQGNYIVLFTYLVILNTGLLTLSYFKRWPLINILSLVFTEIIVAGWLVKTLLDQTPGVSYPLALMFMTVLYLLFLGMNTIYKIRQRRNFIAFDFSLLLLLTASYYAGGMLLLEQVQGGMYQGVFTLSAGVIDLLLAWYFFKRKAPDRNLLYLLIGLTLTFLSLAVPVQLEGKTITLFWSAEFVLLLWLFQRSGIVLFRYASLLVMLLTLGSLSMDWEDATWINPYGLHLIFKDMKGIVTNLVVVASFGVYAWLLGKDEREKLFLYSLTNEEVKKASIFASLLLLYVTCIYSINLYFRELQSYEVPNVYHRLITAVFVIALSTWLLRKPAARVYWGQLVLLLFAMLYYLFSLPLIHSLRTNVVSGEIAYAHLFMHWISSGLLLAILFRSIGIIRRQTIVFSQHYTFLAWGFSIFFVLFASIELQHIYVAIAYPAASQAALEEIYGKALLTIIWGSISFVLMWLGMKFKNKMIRIISLTLFSMALVKLFFADIQNVSEGGKIAAFILLGILLLTISFMYQKLKKIIITDES